MIKVVILGTGNVATHLFSAFFNSKRVLVTQVYNRNPDSLESFSKKTNTTTSLDQLMEADIYIIALKDDIIEEIASHLSNLSGLVVHTSGSVGLKALNSCERRGVFYPLQTFSKSKKVDFREIPICLESNSEANFLILRKLAESISEKVFSISSEQRKALHVAAVFVSNFVNHLYVLGENICKENGMVFDLLQPLILETAKKVSELNPKEAQTGPALRNDQKTIDAHFSILKNRQEKEIYALLTKSIQELHGKKL